ncbi:MAG: hypothetical protein KBT34_06980, partial [Prevotella sp.]|nr:hypothetical protein [Candidatus Prevotella equi]
NFEDDHFAYTFFISDHAAQVIKVNDWPTTFQKYEGGHWVKDQEKWAANEWTHPYTGEKFYGDQYAFRSYKTLKSNDKIVTAGNVKAIVGDSIFVDGKYVKITDANYETYKDYVLVAGDKIAGTTYNSVKGFGEAFEKWTLTFEHAGSYDIEYTIRPWNHTRWDVGSNDVGTRTYTYEIQDKVDTELRLSYYETTTEKNSQWSFEEPIATVVIPSSNNDVTDKFNITYDITTSDNHSVGYSVTTETVSDNPDVKKNGEYAVYKKGEVVVLKVNKTTGEVFVGNVEEDVKIRVSATAKDESTRNKYNDPADKVYTIHVKDFSGNAKWDIMSTCKTVVADRDAQPSTRFTTDTEFAKQMGRFHYIGAGTIIGGTQVKGVPGIMMTVGASGDDNWTADASTLPDLPLCSNQEAKPVVVESISAFGLDADGNPISGTFYQFNPSASGLLTIDANFAANTALALMKKDAKTGKVVEVEVKTIETAKTSDESFTKPLVAGETYYVYNATDGTLRLHGFKYEPKYLVDENTTVDNETTATLFMNGFSSGIPTICVGKNDDITYTFNDAATSDYVEINEEGGLTAKKMTIDAEGNIFKVKVTATVHSSNETKFGDCVAKSSFFYLEIIDIPTYKLGDYESYIMSGGVDNGLKVRTTNIPTAITMTFSGWKEEGQGADNKYNNGKEDQWNYKSAAGENSRIGSELDDDDPFYNRPIDGFGFYNAGNQNPVDEMNKSALIAAVDSKGNAIPLNNGSSYTFASGTAAEQDKTKYYNTTYRLPARGAFVKFEPEESGIVLVYLVQNGSVDYHYGITSISKEYQLKWRPLYITDETGKPIPMAGENVGDNSFNSVSKYLPTGNDTKHAGYYTQGRSRCNQIESVIAQTATVKGVTSENLRNGCSFDWSEFRGTEHDKTALLTAWQPKGAREDIIRLENGGFALPHKAYVRYAFNVKAGKTYFVFQPGSKFEFGGFSFVPEGYPNRSKYGLTWQSKSDPDMMNWQGTLNDHNQENNEYNTGAFTWTGVETFTADKQNCNITINDCRASDYNNGTGSVVPRTFSKDKWSSICLPFSVNESQCKELFGDKYILVTCDGVNDKDQLHFVRHANQYIEAGRPYFVKPSKNGTFAFHNVTIEGAATVSSVLRDAEKIVDPSRFNVDISENEFTFKGIYKRETIPAGSFFMLTDIPGNGDKEDGLYRYNADYKIGGYRAYFAIVGPSSAKAFSFAVQDLRDGEFTEEDLPTGVILINGSDDVKTFEKNTSVYTIGGQKVGDDVTSINKAQKGVYIVNGQKIVVR